MNHGTIAMTFVGCILISCGSPRHITQNAPPPGSTKMIDGPGGANVPPSSKITPRRSGCQRVAPSGQASVSELAKGDNAFLGRLSLRPNAEVPAHRDATEEYIFVLEGSGRISIDGQMSQVQKGDTIFMAAGARVSFQNDDAPFVGIQIFAGPAPAEKYDGWSACSDGPPSPELVGDGDGRAH